MKGRRARTPESNGSPLKYMHSVGLDCDQLRLVTHLIRKYGDELKMGVDLKFTADLLESYIGPQQYVQKPGGISVEMPKRSNRNVPR